MSVGPRPSNLPRLLNNIGVIKGAQVWVNFRRIVKTYSTAPLAFTHQHFFRTGHCLITHIDKAACPAQKHLCAIAQRADPEFVCSATQLCWAEISTAKIAALVATQFPMSCCCPILTAYWSWWESCSFICVLLLQHFSTAYVVAFCNWISLKCIARHQWHYRQYCCRCWVLQLLMQVLPASLHSVAMQVAGQVHSWKIA